MIYSFALIIRVLNARMGGGSFCMGLWSPEEGSFPVIYNLHAYSDPMSLAHSFAHPFVHSFT